MSRRVGQHRFLGIEKLIFSRVDDGCCVEFVDLESQQIDLSRSRPIVSPERSQFRVDLGQPCPRRPQRSEIDRSVFVERGALGCRRQQRLVGVLTVKVDGVGSCLGERGNGGQPTVDVCP